MEDEFKFKDGRYHCPECDKPFTQRYSLKVHLLRHKGEKPHICDICGKCFAQSGTLNRHRRIHSSDKAFSCIVCWRRFNNIDTLNKHLLAHSKEGEISSEHATLLTQPDNSPSLGLHTFLQDSHLSAVEPLVLNDRQLSQLTTAPPSLTPQGELITDKMIAASKLTNHELEQKSEDNDGKTKSAEAGESKSANSNGPAAINGGTSPDDTETEKIPSPSGKPVINDEDNKATFNGCSKSDENNEAVVVVTDTLADDDDESEQDVSQSNAVGSGVGNSQGVKGENGSEELATDGNHAVVVGELSMEIDNDGVLHDGLSGDPSPADKTMTDSVGNTNNADASSDTNASNGKGTTASSSGATPNNSSTANSKTADSADVVQRSTKQKAGDGVPCWVCENVFHTVQSLEQHIGEHITSTGRYKCLQCNKSYNTVKEVKIHIVSMQHTNQDAALAKAAAAIATVTGGAIPANTPTIGSVNHPNDMITPGSSTGHSPTGPFPTPLGAAAGSLPLIVPKPGHGDASKGTGGTPAPVSVAHYRCEYCGEQFYERHTMRVHLAKHTGLKPIVCDLCGRTFAQSGSLNRHKKTVHKFDATGKSFDEDTSGKISDILAQYSKVNGDGVKVGGSQPMLGKSLSLDAVSSELLSQKRSAHLADNARITKRELEILEKVKNDVANTPTVPATNRPSSTAAAIFEAVIKDISASLDDDMDVTIVETESIPDTSAANTAANATDVMHNDVKPGDYNISPRSLPRVHASGTESEAAAPMNGEEGRRQSSSDQSSMLSEFLSRMSSIDKTVILPAELNDAAARKSAEIGDENGDYECVLCNKKFMHKYTLKVHTMMHSGEKPHTCKICHRSFGQSGTLNRHMRNIHANGKQVYDCDLCVARFRSEKQYHKHLAAHNKVKRKYTTKKMRQEMDEGSMSTSNYNSSSMASADNMAGLNETPSEGLVGLNEWGNVAVRGLHDDEDGEREDMEGVDESELDGSNGGGMGSAGGRGGTRGDHEADMYGDDVVVVNTVEDVGDCMVDTADGISDNGGDTISIAPRVDNLVDNLPSIEPVLTGTAPITPVKGRPGRKPNPNKPPKLPKTKPKSEYLCTVCKETFPKMFNLKLHMMKHNGTKFFTCSECGIPYTQLNSLHRHMLNIHKIEKPITASATTRRRNSNMLPCKVCGKEFKSPFHHKKHEMLHKRGRKPTRRNPDRKGRSCVEQAEIPDDDVDARSKVFGCTQCRMSYNSHYSLKLHQLSHNSVSRHSCNICNVTFINARALDHHLLKTHQINRTAATPHHATSACCVVCEKRFTMYCVLKRHVTHRHSNMTNVTCQVCSKVMTDITDMKHHVMRHNKDKWYECSLCDERFRLEPCYVKHLLAHNLQAKISCLLCEAVFSTGELMTSHLQSHIKIYSKRKSWI